MVLRSESLRQLKIVTPLPASSLAPRACATCGSVSASVIPPACPCFEETVHGAHGATAQEGDSATASHPREFIFEAWMRHVGPSLRSLTLSRAVPVASSTNCGGNGSVVVNLWEEEDASLHLAHISRHCTNLRSLSMGHVSLSAPTLLATLQPMPALQHLSLSWLHACPAALHAVLDAAPNLRHLTIFMASGLPRLHLRLLPSLQHLSLSYIRADSVTLHSARSLQTLSIRDMFLRSLSIRDAPNLRQLSVASANSLLVSAPHSSRLASIDLRAGSLNWAATETLISTNWAALESLSLDFFATTNASGLPSVSSLPWLARNCPGLKSLRLGALAWQNMVDSAALSGLLLPQRNSDNLWPPLEALTVRIAEKAPEGLLLLHSILSNIPTLMGLNVTVEGEEDEEEEEEAEEMEYDGDCDAMSMDEDEQEDEGNYIPEQEASDLSHTHSEASTSSDISGVADAALAVSTQPAGYWPALTAAERQHQLFLKGLDCLQRRYSHCLPPPRRALLLRASRPAAARTSRLAALCVTPCGSHRVAPYCSQRVAPCCPARRALLQPARRALLQPARRALLPCASRPAAASASRPTAASASRSAAPRVAPFCSQRVAPCCPAQRAPYCPAQRAPCCSVHCTPYPAARGALCPAEPRRPARAALPNLSRVALPQSPTPPSRPAVTTAVSAGRATGAGGAGGATGSAGGDSGAGGAGPTTDRHCLSWPLSRQLQQLGVDSGGHSLSWTTPPLSSFASGFFSEPVQVVDALVFYRFVTDSVEAAALGANESAAALGASESTTALGASESTAALGARASPATGPSSAEALHTFTLNSGVSRCFFRDCTTLTPLAAPVPVSLADPTGGPVVARASIVLPCPAVSSDSLSGLHLPTFLTTLHVAICTCSRIGRHLATFIRWPGSSLYTLTTTSAQVAEAGQVAASNQVSASGQLTASCSCRIQGIKTPLTSAFDESTCFYTRTRSANTADIFTKALAPGDHQRFCTLLGTAGAGGAGAVGAGGAVCAGGATGAAGSGGAGGTAGAGGATGAADTGGTGDTAGAGGAGAGGTGGAGAAGPGGARIRGAGAGGPSAAEARGADGDGGAGGATRAASAGGAGATHFGGAGAAGSAPRQLFFYPQPQSSMSPPDSVLRQVLSLPSSTGLTPPLMCPLTEQSQPQLLPSSSLPAPAPHTEVTESPTERHEPVTCGSTPDRARRVTRPRPPAVPGTHGMALRPSSVPLCVVLPEPPASSIPHVPDPESDLARAASPTFDLEYLAAALPCFALMLLCPEGDPDALDIPTLRSYAEAIAGFSQRQGVEFFQTFSPTLKMTNQRVLLHVAARRDYELHSLDFSTAFLQGSLHEDIWLRRPPGFIGSFPGGSQWSLRRPVYGLRQAPREWHDTLRTTLAALGFAPSSVDPSLFLRTDTTLPPFYVLVYVDDLVFATADTKALALVLQCFSFYFSSPQPIPLSTGHSLSAPPSDESVEPSGPYPELVGCIMYLMTCTRPDLAYPLSLLTHYVAPVHRAWGSCLEDRVQWSTRSSSVLSSSCEAEIYDRAMAAQELRWLTYLLTDLGDWPRSPPVLYVDIKAMLALCHEQRLEHRTKHITLRYFLARELQQRRRLRLSYVALQTNTANVFTKAPGSGDHQRFCTALGLVPSLPHLLVA
ncbi:unnamed protein product [Closterium sp. NIES-53]